MGRIPGKDLKARNETTKRKRYYSAPSLFSFVDEEQDRRESVVYGDYKRPCFVPLLSPAVRYDGNLQMLLFPVFMATRRVEYLRQQGMKMTWVLARRIIIKLVTSAENERSLAYIARYKF